VAGVLAYVPESPVRTRVPLDLVALAAGLTGMVIGGLVVAADEGGPGTGYRIVGGFAALAIGLIPTVLGWLTLARSRRIV
jgi:Family of unknown function (DUF6223)